MVQWLRVRLPIQEQFHPWSRKIPQTTKSVHHNYWGHALEPTNHDPWSPLAYSTCSAKTEAPAARSPCTATREQALPSTTRESPHSGQDPAQPKINKVLLQKKKKKGHFSAQCYVAVWMGREFGGERIYVHVWPSPFAVHLKQSQHCLLISYTPLQNKMF